MKLYSLGLSCQARMIIDLALGKQPRRPFDWCISEKEAVLAGLRTRGASFQHDAASSHVYRMPLEQREGVESGGVYFWHDYPKADRLKLSPEWPLSVPKINEKYAFVWQRFLNELEAPGHKVFVIATTQHNLPEYALDAEDFARRFQIDGPFIDELAEVLTSICGEDFSVVALVRDFAEADAVRDRVRFERLTLRVCGSLSLVPNQSLADLINKQIEPNAETITLLEGKYDVGAIIIHQSHDTARVFRTIGNRSCAWAECYPFQGGYMVSVAGKEDGLLTARLQGNRLIFSDGETWVKQRDH